MDTKSTLHFKFLVLGHLGRQMLSLWCFLPLWQLGTPAPASSRLKQQRRVSVPCPAQTEGLATDHATSLQQCYEPLLLTVFSQSVLFSKLATGHLSYACMEAEGNSTRWKTGYIVFEFTPRCLFVSESSLMAEHHLGLELVALKTDKGVTERVRAAYMIVKPSNTYRCRC